MSATDLRNAGNGYQVFRFEISASFLRHSVGELLFGRKEHKEAQRTQSYLCKLATLFRPGTVSFVHDKRVIGYFASFAKSLRPLRHSACELFDAKSAKKRRGRKVIDANLRPYFDRVQCLLCMTNK